MGVREREKRESESGGESERRRERRLISSEESLGYLRGEEEGEAGGGVGKVKRGTGMEKMEGEERVNIF